MAAASATCRGAGPDSPIAGVYFQQTFIPILAEIPRADLCQAHQDVRASVKFNERKGAHPNTLAKWPQFKHYAANMSEVSEPLFFSHDLFACDRLAPRELQHKFGNLKIVFICMRLNFETLLSKSCWPLQALQLVPFLCLALILAARVCSRSAAGRIFRRLRRVRSLGLICSSSICCSKSSANKLSLDLVTALQ